MPLININETGIIIKVITSKKEFFFPSLFEKLYVKAYNDTAIEILQNIFELNCISVKNIDFDASYDNDYITFTFTHKTHKVYYHIFEEKIEYFIDSPEKYDHLTINQEYEKKHNINININV